MINVNLYLREGKNGGLARVEMSVTINRERVFFKISEYDVKKWSSRAGQKYQYELKNSAMRLFDECRKRGLNPTAKEFREYYLHGIPEPHTVTILELADEICKDKKREAELGIIINKSYRKYLSLRVLLLSFFGDSEPLSALNAVKCRQLLSVIQAQYLPSTASGYWERFKTMLRYGVECGYIEKSPADGIKCSRGKGKVDTVTPEEYERIRDTDFGIERVNRVRDLWVLMANTGLAWCDMAGLRSEDIRSGRGGVRFIKKPRQKTGVWYTAVVLPDGADVLSRYPDGLPVISNQKMNCYLKEIQSVCGISSVPSLTCHRARHFYATRLLNSGVAINQVALAMGHSRIQQTMEYVTTRDEDVIDGIMSVAV